MKTKEKWTCVQSEPTGDAPSLTQCRDQVWLVWKEWAPARGDWRIMARTGKRDRFDSEALELRRTEQAVDRPRMLIDGKGDRHLLWLEGGQERWHLMTAAMCGDGLTKPRRLSGARNAVHYSACCDRRGDPWVVWQGGGTAHGRLYVCRYKHGRWSRPSSLAGTGRGCWRPSITMARRGGVWVAWDAEDNGTFSVFARHLSPEGSSGRLHQISASRDMDFNVSLAEDAQGRLWIAWERGAHWNEQRIYRLAPHREIVLRCLDPRTGRISVCDSGEASSAGCVPIPRGRWGDNVTCPVVIADDRGVHLYYRRIHVPGDRAKGINPWGWSIARVSRTGKSWRGPEEIGTDLGYSMSEPSVLARNGHVLLACQTCRHPGGKGPSSEPGVTVFQAHRKGRASAAASPHVWSVPARPLRHRPDVAEENNNGDGKKRDTVIWGDLHRHSDSSLCVAPRDGSLWDHYRWAWFAAGFGFYCITDHVNHLNDYQWEECLNLAGRFNAPGAFVPLIGFEAGPCGDRMHFNVYARTPEAGRVARRIVLAPESSFERVSTAVRGEGLVGQVFVIPHCHGVEADTPSRGLPERDPKISPWVEVVQTRGWSSSFANAVASSWPRSGFTGSSDHASAPWARAWRMVPGWQYQHAITGLWVREHTKEGVFDALSRGRSFATNGVKLVADIRINGRPMGSMLRTGKPLSITVSARGTTGLVSIEIIRDGKVVHAVDGEWKREMDVRHIESYATGLHYYYARIRQDPEPGYGYFGESWTTPVWVDGG